MMMTTSDFSATSLPDLQTTPPPETSSGAIGRDIVQKQPVAGGLKMARHRAAHGAEADKADIDHFNSPLSFLVQVSAVVVLGLHSQPIQPR